MHGGPNCTVGGFMDVNQCKMKIFEGEGVVTPSTPSMNNFCLYPPPVSGCFWKDPLMTPPPHFKHLSLLLLPIHHPAPPPPNENFDHTLTGRMSSMM